MAIISRVNFLDVCGPSGPNDKPRLFTSSKSIWFPGRGFVPNGKWITFITSGNNEESTTTGRSYYIIAEKDELVLTPNNEIKTLQWYNNRRVSVNKSHEKHRQQPVNYANELEADRKREVERKGRRVKRPSLGVDKTCANPRTATELDTVLGSARKTSADQHKIAVKGVGDTAIAYLEYDEKRRQREQQQLNEEGIIDEDDNLQIGDGLTDRDDDDAVDYEVFNSDGIEVNADERKMSAVNGRVNNKTDDNNNNNADELKLESMLSVELRRTSSSSSSGETEEEAPLSSINKFNSDDPSALTFAPSEFGAATASTPPSSKSTGKRKPSSPLKHDQEAASHSLAPTTPSQTVTSTSPFGKILAKKQKMDATPMASLAPAPMVFSSVAVKLNRRSFVEAYVQINASAKQMLVELLHVHGEAWKLEQLIDYCYENGLINKDVANRFHDFRKTAEGLIDGKRVHKDYVVCYAKFIHVVSKKLKRPVHFEYTPLEEEIDRLSRANMKLNMENKEVGRLKTENERLKTENERLKSSNKDVKRYENEERKFFGAIAMGFGTADLKNLLTTREGRNYLVALRKSVNDFIRLGKPVEVPQRPKSLKLTTDTNP